MAIEPDQSSLRLDADVCNTGLALTEPPGTITSVRLLIRMDFWKEFGTEMLGKIFGWNSQLDFWAFYWTDIVVAKP